MRKQNNIFQLIYYYAGRWIGARYIYKELIMPFIFSISIVTFVLFMNYLIKEIDRLLGKNLSALIIIEFIYLNMAWIVAMSIPMAVLVACIMAYGRLAEDNEIVALRSSGISFLSILSPAFVFGVSIAILMFLFYNNILPEFNFRLNLLTRDIANLRPGITLEPGYFIDDMEGYSIYFKEKNKDHLLNLTIYDKNPLKSQTTIYADSGKIAVESNNLVLSLFSGEIHELDIIDYDDYRRIYFTKHKISIAADDIFLERNDKAKRNDREMNIRMMLAEVKKNRKSIEKLDIKIAAILKSKLAIAGNIKFKKINAIVKAKIDSNTKNLLEAEAKLENRKLTGILNRVKNEKNLKKSYKKRVNKYLVEINKKLSMPFACIIFVMIGTPIGVMSKQGSVAVAGVSSILFFLIYYVFLIGGEELADMAVISPFWGMWTPNFLLGGVGIYMIYSTTYELKTFNIFSMFSRFRKKKNNRGDNADS